MSNILPIRNYIPMSKADYEAGDPISVCAECGSPDCCEVFSGDEGLTICPDCGATEQGYRELSWSEAVEEGMI